MKRFAFRLDGVLRIRRYELERARARLAQLEAERRRRLALVEQAQARVAEGLRILAEESQAGSDGTRLALRADGVAVGRLRVARAQRALADLEPALEAAREQARTARVRVRSLEKLRARRAEGHRLAAQAAEQAELEELALTRRLHAAPAASDGTERRIG